MRGLRKESEIALCSWNTFSYDKWGKKMVDSG